MGRKYTDKHIEYLRKIVPGKYYHEVTEMFNKKFNMNSTIVAIRSLCAKNKIRSGITDNIFTKEIEEFIDVNYKNNGPKKMQELVNRKFNKNYTHVQLKNYYGRKKLNSGVTGYFKQGHEPWNKGKTGYMGANKTSFKKGNIPGNTLPIGSERVNVYGYTEIKTGEPSTWELKHRVLWEKHYGKIAEGHAVIFGDGDKSNFDINNLICVSRKQLLRLNRLDLIQSDADLTRIGITIADLENKISEVGKKT